MLLQRLIYFMLHIKQITKSSLLCSVFFLILILTKSVYAEVPVTPLSIFYVGIFTTLGANDNKSLFDQNEPIIASNFYNLLHSQLPYDLITTTNNIEDEKRAIRDHPLCLAFIVTRDDVVTEEFNANQSKAVKNLVNCGITALIYSSEAGDDTKPTTNRVIATIPCTGYWEEDAGEQLTTVKKNEIFIKAATKVLNDYLLPKLMKFKLAPINGKVLSVQDSNVVISVGLNDHLQQGQFVNLVSNNNNKIPGRVTELHNTSAVIELNKESLGSNSPAVGMKVVAHDIRSFTSDTYQVISNQITSAKALQLFQNNSSLSPSIAEWFSGYLADKKGLVVLPPTSANWTKAADGSLDALIVRDSNNNRQDFMFSAAKHKISLYLTGLNSATVKGDDVKKYNIYKAWLKVDLQNELGQPIVTKTFDTFQHKLVAVGQQFNEADVYSLVINELTNKAAGGF